MDNLYKFLAEKIKGKKVVLFGELHGTKEIPELITDFFVEFAKANTFDVFLEMPSDEQSKIDRFFSSGEDEHLLSLFKRDNKHDGKKSLHYFNLIKEIYNLNQEYNRCIRIVCIDVPSNFHSGNLQNVRDKLMAESVLNHLVKQTFVIVGNVHASKKILKLFDSNIEPLGYYLCKELGCQIISVNILPKHGKFYNFSVKEVPDFNSFNKLGDNYDFAFSVDEVTPATFIANL